MLTIDRRSRDINILSALIELIKANAQTTIISDFFAAEGEIKWVKPSVLIDKEHNVVFFYFPTCQKKVSINSDMTSVTDLFMAYDMKLDNDGGESFNSVMKRYKIKWAKGYAYESLESAVGYYCKHGTLNGWATPEVFDDDTKEQDSSMDLDSFLNSVFDPNAPIFCTYCGKPVTACDCDEEGCERFCGFCGRPIDTCICKDHTDNCSDKDDEDYYYDHNEDKEDDSDIDCEDEYDTDEDDMI